MRILSTGWHDQLNKRGSSSWGSAWRSPLSCSSNAPDTADLEVWPREGIRGGRCALDGRHDDRARR